MTPTFACFDANILVRLVSQGHTGCELGHWDTLKGMVEAGRLTMVFLEIVLMEFDKQTLHSDEFFYRDTARLVDHCRTKWSDVWNEVRQDLQRRLETSFN